MTDEQIKKQEFLLNAKAGTFEDPILCDRCKGYGNEPRDHELEGKEPCRKCKGERVVKRRVTVIVEDTAVGGKR